MLQELSIRQFAIIEEVHLTFSQGFHVLTGETGAGKSILIDALGLVLGGRASSEFVRHGAKKAEIEALFELDRDHPVHFQLAEWGLEQEEMLLLRREILANGKSVCRVNGKMVTLAMLRKISKNLIDIHGQHEHQSLLNREEQLEWLDHFGGESLRSAREKYQAVFAEYKQVSKELNKVRMNQQELMQRMDLLRFQNDEIKDAALTPGEEEELEQERNRLAFAEKAYHYLYEDQQGLDRIRQSLNHIEEILPLDQQLQPIHELVQSAFYQLEEAVHELSKYQDEIEFNPYRLNEVEERLYMIRQLQRKYGSTIEEILEYQQKVEQELEQLIHRESTEASLVKKRDQLEKKLTLLAEQLTSLRKKAARKLEMRVEKELADLQMKNTVFRIAFQSADFLPRGCDQIEFQIAPNPGEPPRSLAKIASGGELSRIMLALKCIFTDINQVHTLIFDEIDTGVSGRAAQAIAEKIAIVAKYHQILCVTHLPQVACMADHHFYISKESDGSKTRTQVTSLKREKRVEELARLLGGVSLTETTHKHAEEMLRLAEQVKQTLSLGV
jgi:DNA repair protein RecN (Recombination protein N)